MNAEYKAKRIDNGEWVEGFYVNAVKEFSQGKRIAEIITIDAERICRGEYSYIATFEVDDNTVCRFTGIPDLEGNHVWENDIVKSDYDTEADKYYKCVWDELRCAFVFIHGEERESALHFLDGEYRIKVVGNSFDNPELRTSDWVGRTFKCVYGLDHGNVVTITSEPYYIRGDKVVDTISNTSGDEETIEVETLTSSIYFSEV